MYVEMHIMWIFLGCACIIWALQIRSEKSGTSNQDEPEPEGERKHVVTDTVTETTSATGNDNVTDLEENVWKQTTVTCVPLTDYISCYQNVTFIVKSHTYGYGCAMNKTVDFENELQVQLLVTFFAFNRTFNLALGRHVTRQLNITLVGAEKHDGHVNHTFDNHLSGFVIGEPSSFHGIYEDGILDGILEMTEETYYLEPMDKYFKEIDNFGRCRLVAYREKDIAVLVKSSLRWRQTRHNNGWIQQAMPGAIHETSKHAEIGGIFQNLYRQKRDFATPYMVCDLKVIVDYNFYNIYCGQSIKRVVHEVAYSVSMSDSIFRNVDFDFNGIPDNIGFAIAEILIFENDTFPNYYLGQGNNPHAVLREFTRYDFSKYCLGVLMTYRDFNEGVIGLAFPGMSNMNAGAGGICAKRIFAFRSIRSFNTLLVTPINSGSLLPRRMFALTLAHELGHSFGSGHDPVDVKKCHPSGRFGLYLMNEKTTDYERPNNHEFSPCSLMEMGPVVAHKASCLKVYDAHSLCGNFLIDSGEECDCGPRADTCERFDPCCVMPELGKPGCRVHRELGKHCSPQASPCCTQNCTIEPSPVVCRASMECSHESRCNTESVECPDSVPLADGKLCRGGTRVCRQGLCEMSRCIHHGWEDCQCRTTEEELCELCCKPTNATEVGCVSAYKLADDDDIVRPIYRHPRELCNDDMGYCSEKHHCIITRHIYYNDVFPVAFQLSTREQITQWVSNYWYFVVIGVVSLMGFFNFLRAFYNRKVPPGALALRSAKLVALWEMVDYKYLTLEGQLRHLNSNYEMKLANLENCNPMDMVVGVSRMRILFPTTPQHVIVEVVSNSGCEEFAVRGLLLRGYPLKKVVRFEEEMQSETSTDEETSPVQRTDEETTFKICSDEATTTRKSGVEETSNKTVTGEQTSVEETLVKPFTKELTPVEHPPILHRH